jgi:hypothetical protein
VFSTDSLCGYPHLIPYKEQEKATAVRSWFCLNTAFAETAEEQLNEEIQRLRLWFKQQLNNELPAIITDTDVIKARLIADAFAWENVDELYSAKRDIPAYELGDFLSTKINEDKGYIYCYGEWGEYGHTPDLSFYVDTKTNIVLVPYITPYKIPFIIVENKELCGSSSELGTWIRTFGWGKDILKHLLPKESWDSPCQVSLMRKIDFRQDENGKKRFFEADISAEISEDNIDAVISKAGVLEQDKAIVKKELIECVKHPKGKSFAELVNRSVSECEEEDLAMIEYYCRFQIFIIGVKSDEKIHWFIFRTNGNCWTRKRNKYDFGVCSVEIDRMDEHYLECFEIKQLPYDKYFGRGMVSENLRDRHIAIIGCGAIGSILAESLARSGAKHIGLFDSDIVESGNICRSAYDCEHIGSYKDSSLQKKLQKINPYCLVENGRGNIYGSTNYDSQEECLKRLEKYDLIIDCTASNELLHFFSYALKDKLLISLCITNLSRDIVVISNQTGNVYEQRKAFLSAIEQDTKNFYMEGIGCYVPTFKANHCELSTLVTYAAKKISEQLEERKTCGSFIMSYGDFGIIYNPILSYRLNDTEISLHCTREVLLDIKDMAQNANGVIGYCLGYYSKDLKEIFLLSACDKNSAHQALTEKFQQSNGMIDYIGDIVCAPIADEHVDVIQAKAESPEVNTNNPILVISSGDNIDFQIFLNNQMETFLPNATM